MRFGLLAFGFMALLQGALWFAMQRRLHEDDIPRAVGLLLLTSTVYLIGCYFALRLKEVKCPVWLVAAAAIAFRVTVITLPPLLSDDLVRYQWEGRIQTEGRNPYTFRPADSGEPHIPGKDFRSVYGPLAELSEHAAFRLGGGSLTGMKLPAAAADLVLMVYLARTAPARWLIYAWCPAPILEFWGQGHNDALAILFVTLALAPLAPGVFLGFAAAAKWWPLMLLPALARSWKDWAWALVIPGVLMIPYLPGLTLENARHASGFVGGWRNNDFLFSTILHLAGDQYPAKYTAFAIAGAVALAMGYAPWPRPARALVAITALLAVSANVHPWYLTWIVPLLVWTPSAPHWLWVALMPLAYETAICWNVLGEWSQSPEIRPLIYLPLMAMTLVSAVAKHRERREGGRPPAAPRPAARY
jgi:alpha-1,6-mannosyltransferase